MKKISIIILFYNGKDFYKKCLDSLKEEVLGDEEILCIDNFSKDGTFSLIKKDYPAMKIIRTERNLGFAGGMNLGVKNTCGEIIIFLNQDIYIHPGFLQGILEAFNDNRNVIGGCKIYFPDSKIIQHAGGIIHANGLTNHIGYQEEDKGQYNQQKTVDYVTGAAFAVRRNIFIELGCFDPDFFPGYYEETDICYRARLKGYNVCYIPRAEISHYEATTLKFQSQKYLRTYHRNRLRFVFKNFTLNQIFGKALKYELRWFFRDCPASNYTPLLYAYFMLDFYLLKLLYRKIVKRFSGK